MYSLTLVTFSYIQLLLIISNYINLLSITFKCFELAFSRVESTHHNSFALVT